MQTVEKIMTTPTEQITIRVDMETASRYRAMTEAQRRLLDVILNARLRRSLGSPTQSLKEICEDASRQAQANGLTPEILQAILHEAG